MQRFGGTVFAAAVAVTCLGFTVQSVRGQAVESKTAEQAFKNITQLKGTPADQLLPSMQFISSSLGVDCAFCHVEGKPELDDKQARRPPGK